MEQLAKDIAGTIHHKYYWKIFTKEELAVEIHTRLYEGGMLLNKKILSGYEVQNSTGFLIRYALKSLYTDTLGMRKESFNTLYESSLFGKDTDDGEGDSDRLAELADEACADDTADVATPINILLEKEKVRILKRVVFDVTKTNPLWRKVMRDKLKGKTFVEIAARNGIVKTEAYNIYAEIQRIIKGRLKWSS